MAGATPTLCDASIPTVGGTKWTQDARVCRTVAHSPLTTTAMSTKSISPRASTLASQRYTPSSALVTWRICRLLLASTWYLPSHGDATKRQKENVRLSKKKDLSLIGRHGRPALAPPPTLCCLPPNVGRWKKGTRGTKAAKRFIRFQ